MLLTELESHMPRTAFPSQRHSLIEPPTPHCTLTPELPLLLATHRRRSTEGHVTPGFPEVSQKKPFPPLPDAWQSVSELLTLSICHPSLMFASHTDESATQVLSMHRTPCRRLPTHDELDITSDPPAKIETPSRPLLEQELLDTRQVPSEHRPCPPLLRRDELLRSHDEAPVRHTP